MACNGAPLWRLENPGARCLTAPEIVVMLFVMTLARDQTTVANWSMTELSPCRVSKVRDISEIRHALTTARAQGMTVIAHAAGHSYTDAPLNTNGVIVDVTGLRRILCWDPVRGVMQVEPGVTLREMVRVSLPDGWWPSVTPSTADATIGGCVAMNVTGKNAWKRGSFGEQVLSLTLLLASGELLTVSPANPELFHAVVGSAGLLGIISSVTLQLQRIASRSVEVRLRPAVALAELLEIFEEERPADFLEAWVDGFAEGSHLGRGIVTCT
jgi:decaprenylphospho-beta-D-ribofuranose 2-oxidase